jgi:hypothetical protein
LKALELNGHGRLISVDLPNRDPSGYVYQDGTIDTVYTPHELQPGWIVPQELKEGKWILLLGRTRDVLPTLSVKVDFFFHDSEHSYENMMFEYEWAYSNLSENGVIASDDIEWNNAFRDFKNRHKDLKPIVRGLGYIHEFGLWRLAPIDI